MVTTLEPGQPATVTNVGTGGAAIFDFGIPKGDASGGLDPAQNLADVDDAAQALENIGGAPQETTYSKTEVGALLSGKADTSAVYSKAEIDLKLAGHADIISDETNAVPGDGLIADTSGGAVTVHLPASPTNGNVVTIWRVGSNAVTIDPDVNTIRNVSGSLVLDDDGQGVRLTFVSTEWVAFPEALP
ncbi:hypothetical protein EV665_11325 [Shinella granuli]|uniref:Uncharacterized protein n=1 Tax=Shinella granuli TaxID=323621 RepID=A0A4V2RHR4_SHIGR|nr:hypothetical protein EV665_11325 [Shinella granuli]